MFRSIAVSAGLVAIAAVWLSPTLVGSANGQTTIEDSGIEVTRLGSDAGGLLGSFRLGLGPKTRTLPDGISEERAAQIALARGAAIREAREDGRTLTEREIAAIGLEPSEMKDEEPVRVASADPDFDITVLGLERKPAPRPVGPVLASAEPEIEVQEELPAMWTVTGSKVNLRSGPGTNHAVVTQAVLGETFVPLSDTSSDWIQIQLSDAGDTAWIFAKFLSPADR